MSAFKTISFLESTPENEPGAGFSDQLIGDEGNHAQVPGPQGDWDAMGGFEEDKGSRKKPEFLDDEGIFFEG